MANFDSTGLDTSTFTPFKLENALNTEWQDVRLYFDNWKWFQDTYKTDTIDDYYMNGYGIEGLVKAVLFNADFNLESENIDFDSEGDTCYIHFKNLDDATQAATLAAAMITDLPSIKEMIVIACEQGFDD
jgi:hypothetical protein